MSICQYFRVHRVIPRLGLSLVALTACGGSGAASLATGTGTRTGEPSTGPDLPTTGMSIDQPPPTSTTTTAGTSSGTSSGESGLDPGSSGLGTTGGVSGCGDGIIDPREACDDGDGDTLFCKNNCTLNV